MVQLTIDPYKRNDIEWLFLSSGIIRAHDDKMAPAARRPCADQLFGGLLPLNLIGGVTAIAGGGVAVVDQA